MNEMILKGTTDEALKKITDELDRRHLEYTVEGVDDIDIYIPGAEKKDSWIEKLGTIIIRGSTNPWLPVDLDNANEYVSKISWNLDYKAFDGPLLVFLDTMNTYQKDLEEYRKENLSSEEDEVDIAKQRKEQELSRVIRDARAKVRYIKNHPEKYPEAQELLDKAYRLREEGIQLLRNKEMNAKDEYDWGWSPQEMYRYSTISDELDELNKQIAKLY